MVTPPPSVPELPGQLHRLATAFQKEHESDDAEADLAAVLYALDLQESLPSVRRLRAWTLERLAPRDGETAVDVGSGTGSVVRELAGLVGPAGRAVGVEPNPRLRALAEERAAAAGSAATFLDGDATALPFADGSVDLLRSERVWQHLTDPAAAAAETARVLRPGGRAAILDSDWATRTIFPGDPRVGRAMDDAFVFSQPSPFVGRQLRPLLTRAGLEVDPDIGSSAVVFPDAMLREASLLAENVRRAVEVGAITAEQGETFVDDVRAAAEEGLAFGSVTMFAAVARRPG